MKDIRGQRVPMTRKADAIAEYLYVKQWGPIENPSPVNHNKRRIINEDLNIDTGQFTDQEVKTAIKNLQNSKGPGPDGCINELFKYLDDDKVQTFKKCLNALWTAKYVPDEFTRARIASIYKKGNHDNPENYRPVSLLNTSYKIFTHILKSRNCTSS